MIRPRLFIRAVVTATVLVVVGGCATTTGPTGPPVTAPPGAYACPPGDLLVEGAPVDQSLLESQVVRYSELCRNSGQITVSTARDGGRSSFVNGLVHIAATDSALDGDQIEQAQVRCMDNPAWHLPTATDPVALIHRVDGVDQLTMSPVTLAQVFSGVITRWNDPAIATENPELELPNARIEVVYRGGQTGTTEALSDFLHRQAPDHWPTGGVQSWRGQGRGHDTAEQVIEAVRTTPFALGYVEYSALPEQTVSPTPTPTPSASPSMSPTATPAGVTPTPASSTPANSSTPDSASTPASAPVRLVALGRNGTTVALTPESAQAAASEIAAVGDGPDLVVDGASFGAAPAGWPIHRVSYQLLCSAGLPAEWTALEKDWVAFLLADDAQERLTAQRRVALPADFRERVRTALAGVR